MTNGRNGGAASLSRISFVTTSIFREIRPVQQLAVYATTFGPFNARFLASRIKTISKSAWPSITETEGSGISVNRGWPANPAL
jgi:hypothetical protein